MALHTKKQFALLCGLINKDGQPDTKKLSTYHGRSKLVYSGDYVDDTLALNITFLTEMSAKAKPVEKKPAPEAKTLILTRPLNKKEMAAEVHSGKHPNVKNDSDEESDDDEEFGGNYQKMVVEKKSLEIAELKQKIKKLELGNNKTQGDYVSIDMVTNLMVLHSESLKEAYENGLQEFIVKFAARNALSREEIFDMKKEVTDVVNSTLTKSIDKTKRALRRLQSEVATSRGVGERT